MDTPPLSVQKLLADQVLRSPASGKCWIHAEKLLKFSKHDHDGIAKKQKTKTIFEWLIQEVFCNNFAESVNVNLTDNCQV